jgi:dienelactone hydrolase
MHVSPTRELTPLRIPVGDQAIHGDLGWPGGSAPHGLIIFAHGSGSSRHSPRNQFVARLLERDGFATLLVDLLTGPEESIDRATGHLRFDIGLLAGRLVQVIDWARHRALLESLPIGLFGASTGAGAALVAAAQRHRDVAAVVSRGGRPDLAGIALMHVTAPTLLIVGGLDEPVIALNRDAQRRLHGRSALEIVPGATHLFEEPGTLEQVATLASAWFARCLATAPSARRVEAV